MDASHALAAVGDHTKMSAASASVEVLKRRCRWPRTRLQSRAHDDGMWGFRLAYKRETLNTRRVSIYHHDATQSHRAGEILLKPLSFVDCIRLTRFRRHGARQGQRQPYHPEPLRFAFASQ
jgi:hypothetical protein